MHFDLSKSPVPIDGRVLHTLRLQLHAIKKCFSGKEFVDKVLEIGRNSDLMFDNVSDTESPDSLRRSASLGGSSHVFSPTGQPIEYTNRYACDVAQFLLQEQVLIQLPKSSSREDSQTLTPQNSLQRRHRQLTGTVEHPEASYDSSSYSQDYSPGMHRSGVGSRGAGASSAESLGQGTRRDAYQPYHYPPQSGAGRMRRDPAPEFMNTPTTFYKFADSEDKEQSILYQSQILVASSHVVPQSSTSGSAGQAGASRPPRHGSVTRTEAQQDQTELLSAKRETLYLVFDLLVQRARREKRAKHFLQTPRAVEIQGQRRANSHTNCDLIIKM